MLIYYMFMFALYFIHLLNIGYHGDRSWPRTRTSLLKQKPITVMLTSSIRQCYFSFYNFPNGFSLLADSFL
jgi:cellulose synthase/poly-beta-1,6-N-acetylglucosamine synthase-like glycosyltransferase